MNAINVPSYNSLIPRERQIRAIQDLYDYISRWYAEIGGDIYTKEEVNTLIANMVQSTTVKTIWVGTEQEYEAIVTKDVNTEYNIIEGV